MSRLRGLVDIYACHSTTYDCNVLAAIVHPVPKDEYPLDFSHSINGKTQDGVVCYRDKHAKAVVLTTHQEVGDYKATRDPASDQFGSDLHHPLHPRRDLPTVTFSTVPAPLTGFLGRETELEELRHVLADGKIVLLHAEPGTGKTELAFKYAKQFAADYPGGCFYQPMEHAATWANALPLLIESRTSTTGLTPCELAGTWRQPASKRGWFRRFQRGKTSRPERTPVHAPRDRERTRPQGAECRSAAPRSGQS